MFFLLALLFCAVTGSWARDEITMYALAEGDTFKSGTTVLVKQGGAVAATITYGEDGGPDFHPAVKSSAISGFKAYTDGNGENGNKDGGTFYTIKPKCDGMIKIGVYLKANKVIYVYEDGDAIVSEKKDENYTGTYSFDVTAGKSYKIYATGTKLGFYGFMFTHERLPQPEAYAVYDNDHNFTFYYDINYEKRGGERFKLTSDVNPAWSGADWKSDVSVVEFDPSFADFLPTSTAGWFSGFETLTRIKGMEYLNTSNVTTMKEMFKECNDLKTLDVSHFDTKNVTDMSSLFYFCNNLLSLDVSHFDTRNVTDMSSMFECCGSFTALDLSNFDTKNVTDMSWMFYATSLPSLDLSNFDTHHVTDMSGMFGFTDLTSLDLSNFDTSNVTNMASMFFHTTLTSLDLSSFNTQYVTNMSRMFADTDLTSLDLSNFDTHNVTNMSEMFLRCSKLTDIDLSNFETYNVTDMNKMFDGCQNLQELNLLSFDFSDEVKLDDMFNGCTSLTTIYCNDDRSYGLGTSNRMFEDCTSLVGGNGTPFNPEKTDAEMARPDGYFPGYFTRQLIGDKDAGYVVFSDDYTTMTFYYDDKINEREGDIYSAAMQYEEGLGEWRPAWFELYTTTKRVVFDDSYAKAHPKSMYKWFSGMYDLEEIVNIEVLNTSETTNMSEMFYACGMNGRLDALDLSNFDVSKVTDFSWMFCGCGMKTISASCDWSAQATDVQTSYMMFADCGNLVGGKGTPYDGNNVDLNMARPDGGSAAPGYFTMKEPSQKWPEGDLTHDGKVDADDVVALVALIMNPGSGRLSEGDLNKDGVVNAADVVRLTKLIK